MSIGGVGGLNQYLSVLLNRLAPVAPSGTAAAPRTNPSQAISDAPAVSAASGTPPTQTLSDQILALLTQLQQIAASPAASAASVPPTSTSIATASSASSPLAQLMAAMDSDGDGTVSQSEMESYIQNQGGTKDQADALFAGLKQGSTGNLTQSQLASDLQSAQAAHGRHHHHHHHGMPSADQVGADFVSAMDSNGDGSVDQSEFSSFVTSQGGTASEAAADFSALDPNGTGSIGAAQFSAAISAFEHASQTVVGTAASAASPVLGLLDAFNQPAASNTTNVVA